MSELEDRWSFNDWAKTYDKDIRDETLEGNWIYENYESVLDKIVEYSELSENDYSIVLDIGVGTGNLAGRFLERNLSVIGIDPSKEMRKICIEKYPELQVNEGNFLNIPIISGSVDIIVSSYAFHHLTQEQKETSIVEMRKVLKPKGRIVIADLMFKNTNKEGEIKESLRKSGQMDVIEAIEDEYFGSFDELNKVFRGEGFSFRGEQLTPFVWIFQAILSEEK